VWLIFQHLKISMFHLMRKFIRVRGVVLMLPKCLKGEERGIIMPFCVDIGTHLNTDIMAEWLALLLHIQEVSGSNLGPETSYPD
jgi:hypothetical protein